MNIAINPATVLLGFDSDRIAIQQGGEAATTHHFNREDAKKLRDALNMWLIAGEPAANDKENKVAVMLSDGDPVNVIFAMSKAAWEYISDGKTHTFDLTGVGIPINVMIAGGPTRAGILDDIERGIVIQGGTFERGGADHNLSIKEPTKQ